MKFKSSLRYLISAVIGIIIYVFINNVTRINIVKDRQLPWSYNSTEVCKSKDPEMPPEQVKMHQSEWKTYMKRLKVHGKSKNAVITRGIVYTGNSQVLKQMVTSILMLRHYKCDLPIEIWHFGSELAKDDIRILETLDKVRIKDLKPLAQSSDLNLKKRGDRMWEMKGASLLYSSFDQILYLDSDNIPVKDPTFLFETQAFQTTGAIFWKDFGKLRPDNAIWRILGKELCS